jgi:hypothetical protein
MRMPLVLALALLSAGAPAGAEANPPSASRTLPPGCSQGSTTGVCAPYRWRAPPPPPERPFTPPRSSEQIVPPMERAPPLPPMTPRVGN